LDNFCVLIKVQCWWTYLQWCQSSNCVTFNILSFSNNWNKNCVYKICTLNICCCLIKHPAKLPWKHHTTIPWDKPHAVPQITQ